MSPWLVAVIFVSFFLYCGLIVWEEHLPGGNVRDALLSWQHRQAKDGPTALELTSAVVLTLALVWFTFFSDNKRVTKDDKKIVALMLVGAAIGWLSIIGRYFLRH
jgi:predicted small integral membrane protein